MSSLLPFLLTSGIEWLSQSIFVSYAHSSPGNNGHVKNEIASVDIRTGTVTLHVYMCTLYTVSPTECTAYATYMYMYM